MRCDLCLEIIEIVGAGIILNLFVGAKKFKKKNGTVKDVSLSLISFLRGTIMNGKGCDNGDVHASIIYGNSTMMVFR
jgi:hypothetical protein